MPNEFQNRDSMLNSIAKNAANNTMINPKPVEEGIKVPHQEDAYYGFRDDASNQNSVNTESSYETMIPPKPVAIDPNLRDFVQMKLGKLPIIQPLQLLLMLL